MLRRCALPAAALAVPLSLMAELLPIRSYSTADGLASDSINQILADSHGFVWFCTPEGLSRFDGYRFVNFGVADGLPHRRVTALLETRAGEYLVGTARGLCGFGAEGGGKLTAYSPGNDRYENAINVLTQDSSGRIWCGTAGGLFEILSGHRFRRQPLAQGSGDERISINDVLEDSSHKLWLATRAGIYVVGTDGGVQHIAMGNLTQNVRALWPDHHGRIWAATQGGLAFMREADTPGGYRVEQVYNDAAGVKALDVTSFATGSDGSIWAGASAGIVRWLASDRPPVFRMLTRAQGLIDRQVNNLAADRAGNMWAATEAAGVMKIQPTGFTTFREQDGLATDRVWSLLADRTGAVLAVTAENGREALNRFDGTAFHALSLQGFSEHPTWGHHILLQARSGAWWAATNAGLCTYAAVFAVALAGKPPNACYARDHSVTHIFEDSTGRIWASAQQNPSGKPRLMRWDPARQSLSSIEDGPRNGEPVTSFAEDRAGSIWLAAGTGDLLRYSGGRFIRFTQTEGVLTGFVRDLFVDSGGRLWIASANGLGLIEHPDGARFGMRVYRTAEGLSSNTVMSVAEDGAGRIYASTLNGIDRLDPATGRMKHFSAADGLAHGQIRVSLRDNSGDLWFATTQGLSRLSPTKDRPPDRPSVRITELRLGRERYPVSQAGQTRIVRGDLEPSQNQLQVAFVGFSDEPEANLRYTYMLEGGDTAWQGPGRDHEANYPGLEPGSYRFLVKALNSEGQQSQTPAEIDFVILPPVWRRWWFEALALLTAAGLAVVAYRRRVQAMTARVRLLYEERLDERTRIARELHDTLLQNLAGISLQLDGVAKQVGRGSDAAASQIRAVRQQVDASFREARQKVQDLRSPMLQGRRLPEVLRESLEQIVAGHPVALRTAMTGQARPLREEVDEAVLRIGQEAVGNAVRHARAKEIHVSLTYEDRFLRLRVQDDGQGFNLAEASQRVGHWGLRNMQERAQRIGAQWKLATAPGQGTEIEVQFPLPEDQ